MTWPDRYKGPMTTPTTAELRAWAREQGMDVGDRGRLSPEVRAAWDAAHSGKGTGAKTPTRSARTTAARTTAAPAKVAAATTTRRTPTATARRAGKASGPAAETAEAAVPPPSPEASPPPPAPPVVLQDDPRLDDLERKLGELSRRVAQLERAATATPPRRVFRRRG